MFKYQTSPLAKNHRLASCHFRALARSKSSCAWATSRPMAPWRQVRRLPRIHQIYPGKCHFTSLFNDELSICCTNVTDVENVFFVEQALVQRALIRFTCRVGDSTMIQNRNTSQNLESCMGSKNCKCHSMPLPTMIQIFHPYVCHILKILSTYIWELEISIRIHLLSAELVQTNFTALSWQCHVKCVCE